jgi:uncharacterized protein (TIGR03437 family)
MPATQAVLSPNQIALNGSNLYIVDRVSTANNARVRLVTPATAPPLPQPPKITQVVNAIDYSNAYSPGGLVSIMGNYLASPSVESAQIGPDGRVTAALGGDTVTFAGTAAPLLYVSAAQINTVVPYGAPLQSIAAQVQTAAGSDSSEIQIKATSLAVLSGLVFNPNNLPNSITNPAPKGATLVLYGTGMGQTSPGGADGAVVQGPSLPAPVAKFTAGVSDGITQIPSKIVYLGPLPGAIAGAMQVNVQMPDSASPGQSTLWIASDSGSSTQAQTIYLLSDPPVLTGITPASPIPQVLGSGTLLTLNGTNLNKITGINFYLAGQPVTLQQAMFMGCTATACTESVYFGGQSGDFGVEAVNAAKQVSNRFLFTVQPLGPPTITSVEQYDGRSPLVASKGSQWVRIDGTNFQTPLSVNFFYNGNQIATLSSSNPAQIFDARNYLLAMNFDFQGNAGQYAVEVVNPDGKSSGRFNFTVQAP